MELYYGVLFYFWNNCVCLNCKKIQYTVSTVYCIFYHLLQVTCGMHGKVSRDVRKTELKIYFDS